MIALTDHADGIILPVRAQPKARRPGVTGEQNGSLKVAVSAPPEDGKANHAIVAALADELGIRRAQIELLSGAANRDKKFLIRGMPRADLETRLNEVLSR